MDRPPDSTSSVAHSLANGDRIAERQDEDQRPELDRAGHAGQRGQQRDRLQPGRAIGGRRHEQVVDEHRALEARGPRRGAGTPPSRRGWRCPRRARSWAAGARTRISALPRRRPGPWTTSAARVAGAVLRLRPMTGDAVDEDHRDPRAGRRSRGPRAQSAADRPAGRVHDDRSATRPAAITPVRDRGRGPCCRSRGHDDLRAPRRRATPGGPSSRRIPSGTTPVPDGASLPRMTRSSASASAAAIASARGPSGRCRSGRARGRCPAPRRAALDVAARTATSSRR